MLVLSRRVDEELVFPNLGISIKVLRSQGNRVRLGIEAPEFVEINRGELMGSISTTRHSVGFTRHDLLNELNSLKLALAMYDRQLDRGDIDGANQTFLRLVEQLRQVDLRSNPISKSVRRKNVEPKVLVVDDDANERQLMAGLLEMEGCQVFTAGDGLEALNVLESAAQPDVVLLDMQMPRLGGKETLIAIRGHDTWRRLVVFGVSGCSPAELGISIGKDQGVDEWFGKPLNPNELVNRIRQQLSPSIATSA